MFRSLRHRNYRLFLSGQLISLIGTWMQSVAQAWLVYRLTGSAALLGWVGFAGQIPVFLLAPLGGAVADRYDRRRIIIAAQATSMAAAFALAGLAFSGAIEPWHIIALASCLGIVNAFDIPARQSFLQQMVGREDLPNAIALNSSMFNGARIVGPAVAGLLVGAVGEAWCFLLNGLSYLAVLRSLSLIRVGRGTAQPQGSAAERIVEGFHFVHRTRPIRMLLGLLGVASLVGMPYTVLMPVFAREILRGDASSLGTLMSSTGLGALAGALLLARRSGYRGLGRLVAAASAGFGLSLIAFSFSRSFWLSVVLLFPVGLSMMLQMASSNTLVQAMTPDYLRGRVMAVYSMMFMGMAPFGALLAGTLAGAVGATTVVAGGGAISVLGGLWFAWALPKVRTEARELIVAQQATPGEPPQGMTAAIPVRG